MYRLVLNFLMILLGIAVVLGAVNIIPYNPLYIIASALFLFMVSWISNLVFAWAFNAPTNIESVYITAFILALIISPAKSLNLTYIIFMAWAAIWAMASKYIFTIGKKHIFNPAAFAVALTSFTINQSASWWIGTASLAPFVLIGGLLIVRKIRRADLVWSFFITALVTILTFNFLKGYSPIATLQKTFLDAPIMFFAFIMLTEPLTTPPTKKLRMWYGALVGFFFAPQVHILSIYSTPELALLMGNIFSYIVSPKEKLMLKLKEIQKLTADTYNFIFTPDKQFKFAPGQYLEWTLGQVHADNRGNRRYFTIASSPTEPTVHLGVKFYEPSSSFKKSLLSMKPGDVVAASQLSGDFTLPKDTTKKLVFIAGGIGITPFRSMVKHMLDTGEKRNTVLLYSNKNVSDIAYKNIFDEAASRLGMKTIYTLTDTQQPPQDWSGQTGYVNETMIKTTIPDFAERIFYVSGPQAMVTEVDTLLKNMGIPSSHIKKDFFPGFA